MSSHRTTAARAALRRILRLGRTQSEIAATLGVSQPSVWAWVQGNARPEPHLRQAIESIWGIPVHDWETEQERAARESAVARARAAQDAAGPEAA